MKRHGGRSLAAYEVRSQSSVTDIGEVERTVLVATAAGLSPRDFGGKDLIEAIQRRRRGDGSIAGFVSYTTFGVLALYAAAAAIDSRASAAMIDCFMARLLVAKV